MKNLHLCNFNLKICFILLSTIHLSLTTIHAQSKKIITVAGNGYADYAGDGGTATAAQFYSPNSFAMDNAGNMYIADQGNNCIRKVNTIGIVSTFAGIGFAGYAGDGSPASAAELNQPSSVVTDVFGNVYVADEGNNRVRKIDKSGNITTIVGNGHAGYSGNGGPATTAEINRPASLAIDGSGNIYIADELNERIEMVSAGVFTTIAGKGNIGFIGDTGLAINAYLNHPAGVAIDGIGNVYIADQDNNRIRVVNPAGIISTLAGYNRTRGYSGDGGPATAANLYYPSNVGVDNSGNVFIVDGLNRIRVVNSGMINTFAGTGIASYSGDGGPATSAQMNIPTAIVSDNFRNMYISDSKNDVVRKVDTLGVITTILGDGSGGYCNNNLPATGASIRYPDGVALDKAGNIYVADKLNDAVRKISAAGIITTIAGNGVAGYGGDGGPATAAGLNNPSGVATDGAGNVYITDNGNSCIRKVDTATGLITTIAGNGTPGFTGDGGQATTAKLNSPYGIATDAAGNIYFTDAGNYRVRVINTGGIISTIAGDGIQGYSGNNKMGTTLELSFPAGIAIDKLGNVFVADAYTEHVWKISANDTMKIVAGTGFIGYNKDSISATTAELNYPMGVAVDDSGRIYISDQGNNRIRKINSNGKIYTIAGTGTAGYTGDGGASVKAKLNAPGGIAIDSAGNIFFADHNNNRIRKLTGNVILAESAIIPQADVRLYPNPNKGTFTLQVNSEELRTKSEIEIYNVIGEKIYSESFNIQNSTFKINLGSQPMGIYMYRIMADDGSMAITGKFVIE